MNKILTVLAAAMLALGPGLFYGCQNTDGGTEIPNELTGRERIAGGGIAADAEVRLIPVGHIPGDGQDTLGLILTTRTDAEGRFAFDEVPRGRYNILAEGGALRSFRDSVLVTGKGQSLPDDTLRAPGSLAGTVRLQPQHDPRTATVQILGTQVYMNVAADGSFRLADLGSGQYRLRVVTTEPGYTPLFADASVSSGADTVLPRPLEPFYSGIPVVEGLTATPRPDGTILVSWKRSAYPKLQSYVVARDDADVIIPKMESRARLSDTAYVDTIYSRTPRSGQFAYHDTVAHAFEYRVNILDKSGERGPFFDAAVAVAIPPFRSGKAGTWKPVTSPMPFARRWGASMVAAGGRLWLIGGMADNDYARDAWSSADGVAWELAADSLPFQDSAAELRAVALKDSLFVVRAMPREVKLADYSLTRFRLEAWISGDGKAWRRVADSLPFSPLRRFDLAAAGGEAWIVAGYGEEGSPRYWRSSDGAEWSAYQGGIGPKGILEAEGLGSRLFVLDSAGVSWSASAGGNWSRLVANDRLVIDLNDRETLVAHEGRLWHIRAGYGSALSDHENEVWSTSDGRAWTLVDVDAAFGSRKRPAAGSFGGKLWLLGGEAAGTGAAYDGWFLESP